MPGPPCSRVTLQTCVVAGCECSAWLSTWRTGWKSHSPLGGRGNLSFLMEERSCSSAIWSPLSLWDALAIAALSGGAGGRWPCHQPVPQPVLSLRCRSLCLPRDRILMFAERFETQCMVQSTDCSSQESKAVLRQVVPGQSVVLTLGWHVACVPREVGHEGTGWAGVGRESHLFPCPSEMLSFICKQLH